MQEDEPNTFLDEFRIIRTLGTGYHATFICRVKLAETPNHQLVAIKRFKPETANLDTLKHQLSVMKLLHHDNLVNLINVRESATYKSPNTKSYTCFAIILQYVSGGQLFDFIAIGGRFNEVVTRTYFFQLLNAVNYMHSKGFAHRDIKPQNILLTNEYVLKLADFGFATLLEGKGKSGLLHTKLGTEGYMAPEIGIKQYQGTKADIFSCGVILFIMYSASPPFEKSVPNDPFYKLIKEKEFEKFWKYHSKKRPLFFYKDDFKDLIQKLLAYDPKQRPSMVEISKHPWCLGEVVPVATLKGQFEERKSKMEASMLKDKQEKEGRKAARQKAVQDALKDKHQSDSEILNFVDNYHKQTSQKKELDTKKHIENNDCVVKETEEFVYSTLTTYLAKPVTYKDQEFQIQYTPSYERWFNRFLITYTFDHAKTKQNIVFSLVISKSKNGMVVLSPKRVSGNCIHYRRAKNLLMREFCYCTCQ